MAEISQEPAATTAPKHEGASISESFQPSNVVFSTIESSSNVCRAPPRPLNPQGSSRNYKEGDIVGGSAAPLDVENRGRKLLEKMGYTPGTPLGRGGAGGETPDEDDSRRVDPLNIVFRTSRAGLGSEEALRKMLQEQEQEQQKKQKQNDKPPKVRRPVHPAHNATDPGYGSTPYQHPFSIADLRNPSFFIFPVRIRQTLVTSRRQQIALVRLSEILDYYDKAYGDASLPGNAFNVILHRCIRKVLDSPETELLLREEGGVVMDEIADESLWRIVAAEYSKKTDKMEKVKVKKEMKKGMQM
ncbi:squalene synthetase-like protein [Rhizina undulata]